MNEPTIDEVIADIKQNGCKHGAFIVTSLERLKRLESQPVPVEPVCVKAMRMFANNGNTDAKEGVEYIDSLQSALKLAQSKIDAYERVIHAEDKAIVEDVIRLEKRAEKAESLNKRMVELLRRLSFLAQTTGGTAGRDDELVKAIDESAELLKEVEK